MQEVEGRADGVEDISKGVEVEERKSRVEIILEERVEGVESS